MDSLLSGLGAAFGFAALQFANDRILKDQGLSCLCPPLGAVAVLLFCMPTAPASQPKAVIGGHLIAGLVSYAIVESNIKLPVLLYPELLAVSLTIAIMSYLKVVHPPAGAYAFLFVNKGMGYKGIYAPGLVGAIILLGAQQVFNVVKDRILAPKTRINLKKD